MKYVLQMIETDLSGNETRNNVTYTFHTDTLTGVLEKYTEFLRGCGFVFNGQVDIVSDEDYYGLDDHVELTDLGEMCLEEVEKHSPHYFDTERNK
jgi:hypothetical protein